MGILGISDLDEWIERRIEHEWPDLLSWNRVAWELSGDNAMSQHVLTSQRNSHGR